MRQGAQLHLRLGVRYVSAPMVGPRCPSSPVSGQGSTDRLAEVGIATAYHLGVAGYTHLYVIGSPGGFAGTDGVNPIETLIFVGEADRMWVEGRYFDANCGPLGRVKAIVPAGPDAPDMLLDACLSFHPRPFQACPSFAIVADQLGDTERLDFDRWTAIPAAWFHLREEARPIFATLHIWRADLIALDHSDRRRRA